MKPIYIYIYIYIYISAKEEKHANKAMACSKMENLNAYTGTKKTNTKSKL